MSKNKFVFVAGTPGVDTGTTGVLDTAADTMIVDVQGMKNISIYVNQLTDAGTCTLLVEKTVDGTNWATVASKAATDFPAGANKALELTLSDGNGMPTRAKQIKVTLSAVAGGGTYSAGAAGELANGYS